MSNQTFQSLKELPTPLFLPQCVLHKHEILICGDYKRSACYSYHILKNEYKFVCNYPRHVKLEGHCVVKLIDNNNNNNEDSNQVTLLSFGGAFKHTLVMKYVSVWSNTLDISNKSNELNNDNQWTPFTDNHNNPIIIGRSRDEYNGVRAVISGSNNHLLFITYLKNNISVFDLNIFQFIRHDRLPTDNWIWDHCFVSNPKNRQGQGIIKTNQEQNEQNCQMLLFCKNVGLSIKYDKDKNIFQFRKLFVCDNIAPFSNYAYMCINDVILFFGGWNGRVDGIDVSTSVHKYSIRENKWMTFKNTLPIPLFNCVAILSKEDNYLHIVGGVNNKRKALLTHMRTKMRIWDVSHLSKYEIKFIVEYWVRTLKIKLGWIDNFDQIIIKYIFSKYTKLKYILSFFFLEISFDDAKMTKKDSFQFFFLRSRRVNKKMEYKLYILLYLLCNQVAFYYNVDLIIFFFLQSQIKNEMGFASIKIMHMQHRLMNENN
ncbi:hypothetical protein RFI_21803 [Reticulomyxa filosa]|uniref:Kelch motif family protein n=1 Tax=Reticulomyxa filosa TaxID=46433 RepID=X6MNH9_RETFI|nr:hypothetical protein RFI_21803 [Reticulomyxa filosa]|eukprot:ETO15558.1 hypothetical protein RFI_21803 [Reticulomyxa filosa]